jgi:hypothetical protein
LNQFQKVGVSWQEVKQRCQRARYQPSLLFYEKYDSAHASIYYQPTEIDNNETIQSPSDESSAISMSVDSEFSNDDYSQSLGTNERDVSHVFSKENFLPYPNHHIDNQLHRNQNNVTEHKVHRVPFPLSVQQQQQQQQQQHMVPTFSTVKKRSSFNSPSNSFDNPSKSRKVTSSDNPHASELIEQKNSQQHFTTVNHSTAHSYSALFKSSPQLHSSLSNLNTALEDKNNNSIPLNVVPTVPFNHPSTPSAPPEDSNDSTTLSLHETRPNTNTTTRFFLQYEFYKLVNED